MSPSSTAGAPEVSVLMSCYNVGRWLPEAIDSVLAQSFENFELVLVDDGSDDNTWEIVKNYRDRDQRIVAVSKPNTGLADSLNVGIDRARGTWIARLDADDLSETTRLEDQIGFTRANSDVVLLGSSFVEIDDQSVTINNYDYPASHGRLVWQLENLHRFFPHSSALFKRDVAEHAGRYNPLFEKTQDWDLWLRLSERGKIACLKKCLVRVRRHAQQVSKSTDGKSQITYGTVAIVCHFLRLQGLPDPSSSRNLDDWTELLSWVDKRVQEEGIQELRNGRATARANHLSDKNRLYASVRIALRLLETGYAGASLREWLFGSSLPRRLAKEWTKQSCAAS